MTYRYAMDGTHHATVYLDAGDELVAVAEINGGNLRKPGDIAAIARATVAALNGTTVEPRVVWHPKAVEALRAVKNWADDGMAPLAPAMAEVCEALAIVDQPSPAEKVVGWAVLTHDRSDLYAADIYGSRSDAREAYPTHPIVRLVEELDQ